MMSDQRYSSIPRENEVDLTALRGNQDKQEGNNHLKTSRKRVFWTSLIHIPAIAITFGVLSLTLRHVFWSPPASGTNVVLNALQFAAQVHAGLIIMSLSAIILHFVHRELKKDSGVPLTFLSASFQLYSISYIFRKDFTKLKPKYIIIFLCAFILSALSGPSSAIIMIPRLQFWSIDDLWIAQGNMDFKVYIAANESTLYPKTMVAEDTPSQ